MKSLNKIAADYQMLANEDMEPEQLQDCLDSIECAFEEKAQNILAVINNMQTLELDEEIKRLQARKQRKINNKERLKEYLRYNMEATGINKITHPLFTVTLGKPTQKVNVTDVGLLPDEFVSVKTEIKPDLNAIKAALKNGSVDGAELVEGKSRLLIK